MKNKPINKYFLISLAALTMAAISYSRLDYGSRKETAAMADKSPAAVSDLATASATPEEQEKSVPVIRVIDGDTIVVGISGQQIHVRLIGINSPELNDKRTQVACLAQKAKEEAQKLLDGQNIYLEKDITQGDHDKYGRLLAYIFTAGNANFNKLMIEEGYAYEYTYNLPYKYQNEFKTAQNEARTAQKGLWNATICSK